jgi:hypothetical protein
MSNQPESGNPDAAQLLANARDALKESPEEAVRELAEEIDDVRRRYLAERE